MSNVLPKDALEAAAQIVGSGPVVMINLITFCQTPLYREGFADRRATSRSAYYEGYAGEFRKIAARLGISTELVYAGRWLNGLLAHPGEDWDDIVIVRYRSLDDLRRILADPGYEERAAPHRLAAVADWQFIATGSM